MNDLLTHKRKKSPLINVVSTLVRTEKVMQEIHKDDRSLVIRRLENSMNNFLEGLIDEIEFEIIVTNIMEEIT